MAETADICIIGAGSSGVAVAKALKERMLRFDCFEIGSDIGGMWRYENDNGLSSAYASLHIDTSRDNLGYSDFPIPPHFPDFLSHREFIAYLERYADHFAVRPLITFNTKVEKVERAADSGWTVTLGTGEARSCRAVIVANGHLWDPRWPFFPGEFAGSQTHSHHYRTAAPYEDQDVLVVGLGNSAVDIAVDLCRRAKSVTISTRRSAWVMPKYLMGFPIDSWSAVLSRRVGLPTRLTRMIMQRLIRLGVGDQARFGLRRPDHPMWREHATLSQELLPYIGHGWIRIRPNITRLNGDNIVFEDGHSDHFDAIIYATGYKISFPFLDPQLFRVDDRTVDLYRRMLPPYLPGLYFLGLVQAVGPIIPLVERQARWIAAVLAGDVVLPAPAEMQKEIAAHQIRKRKTFLDSARYALEVDYKSYARSLADDIQHGIAGI